MPKDVVEKLFSVEDGMAYPARYDMENYDDRFPTAVIRVAHPAAEAFEIARAHWGEEAGTFIKYESGADQPVYPEEAKKKYEIEPTAP